MAISHRLLIYRGEADWVIKTLEKSLKEGDNHFGSGSVQVIDIDKLLVEKTLEREGK